MLHTAYFSVLSGGKLNGVFIISSLREMNAVFDPCIEGLKDGDTHMHARTHTHATHTQHTHTHIQH